MHTFTRSAGVLLLAAAPTLAMAHENAPHAAPAASSHEQAAAPAATTPEATVDAFAQALRRGDTATLRGLLAPDVLILEGGGAERSATHPRRPSHNRSRPCSALAPAPPSPWVS